MPALKHFSVALLAIGTILVATGWARGADAEPEAPPLSAQQTEQMRKSFAEQIAACDAALAKDPANVAQYSHRGDAHLFLGDAREAVRDFEKMIALDPAQDAPHWRLGIAYYFAGDFAKSERQFVKYQAYENGDRENGIWKFLAQTKHDGLEKARAEMLVFTRFDREPFPELYEMFAGKKTLDAVFAEIQEKGLDKDGRVQFFAHYYTGLEEEMLGHREKAEALLRHAVASKEAKGDYMWQVARLQWERLSAPVQNSPGK